jgi:hypothetical protein
VEAIVIRRPTAALVLLLTAGTGSVFAQSAKPSTKPSATLKEPDAKTLNLSAYAELLRSDVRAQKIAILTEVMGFTEAEDAAFWPIYREYDLEMSKLGDERVALIEEYARNYDKLTDEVADKLASRALDLEARRQAVKAKSYERVKAALSPRTALRFLQVEHQLQLLIDLQILASLPIAK